MKNIIKIFSFVTASAIITAASILTVSVKGTEPTEQAVQKAMAEGSSIATAVDSQKDLELAIVESDEVDSSKIAKEPNAKKQDAKNAPAQVNHTSSNVKRTDAASNKAAGSCSPSLNVNRKTDTRNSCSGSGNTAGSCSPSLNTNCKTDIRYSCPAFGNTAGSCLPSLNSSCKTGTCNPSSGSAATPSKESSTVSNTAPNTTKTTVSAYERAVVDLVNDIRIKNGLKPFTINEKLSNVARTKSQDMHDKGYFSHTSPTYGSPFDMMKQFGISYRTAGENIAMGYKSPEAVVDGWMNSEGHRANIMNPSFTQIGVGYVSSGNYWTQMFIG